MRITFFGGASEVGRSCALIESKGRKILVDAGIKLGPEKEEERLPLLPIELMKQIEGIIVTHAHIDHTAFIPFIVKNGFTGRIYITKPSRDIMHLLLSDSVKLAKLNKKDIYSGKDVNNTMKLIELMEYKEEKEILPEVKLKFYEAGHILGSAQALIKIEGKNILFTGDINTRESRLLKEAEIPAEKIDVLITESTYAGKNDLLPSLKNSSKLLADEIKETMKKKGKVLIPVFAVGRGQEILFSLENYIRSNYLPELNVFVDGMIKKATRIYRHNVVYMRPEIPNRILLADDDPFKSKYFKTPKKKNKGDVMKAKNCVIIATSGMLSGGPSISYLRRLSRNPKNKVIIVGYQAQGTNGRKLSEGKKEIKLNGKNTKIKCEVKAVKFSGHADHNGLRDYIQKIKPEILVLVHGEKEKIPEIKEAVHKSLKETKIIIPELMEEIEF